VITIEERLLHSLPPRMPDETFSDSFRVPFGDFPETESLLPDRATTLQEIHNVPLQKETFLAPRNPVVVSMATESD